MRYILDMRTKPATRKRRFEIRLTEAEYKAFAKAAKAEGLSITAWVRRLLTIASREK